MSRLNKLLIQKENLILDITNHLISWDGSSEHAATILSDNDKKFQQLIELDAQLTDDEITEFNEKYRNHWQKMVVTQQELMQEIDSSKVINQQQLSQIDNKQKIVTNYMSIKNKSIFIEKDY